MLEIIYTIFLFGGFGVTYAVVVVPAYLVALRVFRRSRHRSDALLLVGPIGVYLFLTHSVEDRQGFNWYIANLIIAAPVTVSLFVVMYASPDQRPRASAITCLLAVIVAVIAWRVVPSQGMTRLF